MKWTKKVAYILVFLLIFSNLQIVSDAAIYSDVPSWATEAVDRVSEAGLLVGNSNGKFEPYEKVTYFKLVDVLTAMAGYKDPDFDQSITEEEKNYIENAYNVNEWIINNYSKNESKWEHSQDNKIAYLLQKGIFNQGDISLFIKPDGTKGCVTKEALCKYIVRLLDMESDAFSGQGTTTFTDNHNINSMYKPFVALMQDLGIISGDTYDQFNPNQEVTRVILAIFINNVLDYQEEQSNFAPPVIDSDLTEVTGEVTYIKPNTMKVIQIRLTDTLNKYYRVAEDVVIYDGTTLIMDSIYNLIEEKDIIKVLIDSDNVIQKIYLNPLVADDNDNEPSEPSEPSDNTTTSPTEPGPVYFEEITGIVENVATVIDGYKVTLKIQYVAWGNIDEVSKDYLLDTSADITQNGKAIKAHEIEIGAMATVDVNNGVIYSADLKTSKHTIEGTVTGREIYEDKNILKIVDEEGKEREYNVTSETLIHKQGIKTPLFKDIMIGNAITVEAEFENAIQLYCSTDYNTYKGYIEAIEISNDPKVTIRCEDDTIKQFNLGYDIDILDDDKFKNIYDLRLGYQIQIDVDSLEAYGIEILNKYSKNTFEGIINDIEEEGKQIIVKIKSDDIGGRYYLKTITMDNNTKVYKNGSYLSKTKLEEDMQVIITLDKYDNSEADTIHVIN